METAHPDGLLAALQLPFRRHCQVEVVAGVALLHRRGVGLFIQPQQRKLADRLQDVETHFTAVGVGRLDQTLVHQRRQPLLEVRDEVLRHQPQPLLCADHRLELRPTALELLLALDFLALGGFLEIGGDLRALRFVERQFRRPALVVDRRRGAISHRALNVVDADVVAEDRARVGVSQLNRRAVEADEGGVQQGVVHVAYKAVKS